MHSENKMYFAREEKRRRERLNTVMKQDPTVTATGPETALPVFWKRRGMKSRTPSTIPFACPLHRQSELKADRKANII